MFFGAVSCSSQHPSWDLVPNFVATDINGNSHELYEYLREGHTIVLNFMTTWSKPCWAYHNGAKNGSDGIGALHLLDKEHSAEHGGNVIVLMIEGDAETNVECLHGDPACNLTTQGDWVTDNPIPMINDAGIAKTFGVNFFPTVITVCPNGQLFETGTISAEEHWQFIQDVVCQSIPTFDAALKYSEGIATSCSGSEILFDIMNLGDSAITNLEIHVTGVLPEIKYRWKGYLDTFESATLNLGEVKRNTDDVVKILVADEDENPANNFLSLNPDSPESTSHLQFHLRADMLEGDFMTLHIFDKHGIEVVTGGPWADTSATEPLKVYEDFYLPALGCYRVLLEDDYADGLFEGDYCKVAGVSADNKPLDLILDVKYGKFATRETNVMVNEMVQCKTDIDMLKEPEVFQHSTTGMVDLRFNTVQPGVVILQLTNANGEVVMKKSLGDLGTGNHLVHVDFQTVKKGAYRLSITRNGKISSSRIRIE